MKYGLTASRLKEALNNNDMRPQDLANRSGVSKASISQYLNGTHAPSNISSGKMAKVLGVSAPWLMGYDIDPVVHTSAASSGSSRTGPLSPTEEDIIEAYRLADIVTKTMVLRSLGLERKEKSDALSS